MTNAHDNSNNESKDPIKDLADKKYIKHLETMAKRGTYSAVLFPMVSSLVLVFVFAFGGLDSTMKGILTALLALLTIGLSLGKYLDGSWTPIKDNLVSKRNELNQLIADLKAAEKQSGSDQRKEAVSEIKLQHITVAGAKFIQNEDEGTAHVVPPVIQEAKTKRDPHSGNKLLTILDSQVKLSEKRCNVNLIIGVLFAVGGASVLTWSIIASNDQAQLALQQTPSDLTKQLLPIWPKISLVALIELISFYFLALYKSGMADLKHYRGEYAYVHSRVMAVTIALSLNDKDLIKLAITKLTSMERQTVLKKGETTPEIEIGKANNTDVASLVMALKQLITSPDRGK